MNKALQAELARTQAELKPDPVRFARRAALHEQHVRALSDRLRPAVATALKQESAQLVAGGWIDEARQALSQWLLQASTVETTDEIRAREQAERELHAELAESLASLAQNPLDAEIEAHAIELAQLLLSNWIGHLEHALQDVPSGRLDALVDAMPPSARPGSDLEGAEGFALHVGTTAQILADYRLELAMSPQGVIEMTPSVSIFHSSGRWFAARTLTDATSWRESIRAEQRKRAVEDFQRTTAKITTVLSPMANSHAVDFWINALDEPKHWAYTLSLGEERALVEEATLLALSGDDAGQHDTPAVTFVHDLGNIVRCNLNSAIHHGPVVAGSQWFEMEHRLLDDIAAQVHVAPESILRCAIYSTGVYCVAKRSARSRALQTIIAPHTAIHAEHHGMVNQRKQLATIIANVVKTVDPVAEGEGFANFLIHQCTRDEDASQFGTLL